MAEVLVVVVVGIPVAGTTMAPSIQWLGREENRGNGDGVIEPMFTPDSTSRPTRITVRIAAQSPMPDPRTGRPIRCTISSDVALRGQL